MLKVDLAVYDRRQNLVLTVETKKILGVSDDWATQLRRNILTHGVYPRARYFLLATPDKFFLWVGKIKRSSTLGPDYSVDVESILAPFFKEFGTDAASVSEFIFDQIVGKWLRSIMYPNLNGTKHQLPDWVEHSGLGEAIHQGDFFFEMAA